MFKGRFVPPKVGNMPHQQQQSSSEEGSKENTILNSPRHHKEMSAQGHPSGSADSMPQGTSLYSTYTTNWRTTMGSSSQQSEQRSAGSTRMQWNHQWIHQSTCRWKRPRIHQRKKQDVRTSCWNIIRYRFCCTICWII